MKEVNYRLGTTSYIYPADVLDNVRLLKDEFDDIEIVLFESDSKLDIETLRALKNIKREHDISYTVHLPIDLDLCSDVDSVRNNAVCKNIEIIKMVNYIEPLYYIAHLRMNKDKNFEDWQENAGKSLNEIIRNTSLTREYICLENLDYPIEWLSFFLDSGFSLCFDIGHILMYGFELEKNFKKYISRTKIIHLYGTGEKGLHGSLMKKDMDMLSRLINSVGEADYKGVMTLEVFSRLDLDNSLEIIKELGEG